MGVREHGLCVADDRLDVILVSGAPDEAFACGVAWPWHWRIRVSTLLIRKVVLTQPQALLA